MRYNKFPKMHNISEPRKSCIIRQLKDSLYYLWDGKCGTSGAEFVCHSICTSLIKPLYFKPASVVYINKILKGATIQNWYHANITPDFTDIQIQLYRKQWVQHMIKELEKTNEK